MWLSFLLMIPQKAKGPVVEYSALSWPLSVHTLMVKDPETCNSKLAAFQKVHSVTHSISLSVSLSVRPSFTRYNDSLRLSEVLMPIGYLFGLAHTFIYELCPFCLRRGL